MITVCGISVPLATMTALALALHNTGETLISTRIGQAVDGGRDDLGLPERDYARLLAAIERHPAHGLDELRVHLGELLRDRSTN